MGGLGKTTLAGRVFKNLKVIARFGGCRAWITVSQDYTVERLLRDLLQKMCKENKENPPQGISEMDRDSLIVEVKNYLQQKRYVVIFDDVWNVGLWGEIEKAMLDNNNGSRLLITTRSMEVVGSCMNSHFDKVHELKPLTFENSMDLFCKKAVRCHNNGHCPNDLVNISIDLVKKCKGLPLAIVAIGSLLSGKKKTQVQWEKIRQSLSSEMDKNLHLIGITKILDFSYDDLSYYLKSCLLYFGLYPEDYEVRSGRLMKQWIAEGFVIEDEGKTLEDTAQQYLTELIDRSLVQVSSFSKSGKVKSCRVHDLLHDMILRKSKDLSFCQSINKKDDSKPSGMIRRLSIKAISNDLMESTESLHTRSLVVFIDEDEALINKFVQKIPTKYKLLKVLHFENCLQLVDSIPENWGNLAHLRYLKLRGTNMPTELPKFICELPNLETLDIMGTNITQFPKEICKLRKLRHLVGSVIPLFQLKNGLRGMTSLQTLRHVYVGEDDHEGVELIRELGKLKQLRNLSLNVENEEQGSTLCYSLNEMTNLEKLQIELNSDEVIDLSIIVSPPPMLQKLCLDGRLEKFSEWVPQLQNLVQLTLRSSMLIDDPLKSLKDMPHLLFLEINNAYTGERLYFEGGGFQQLRTLCLVYLDNLESINMDKGALQSLEKLQLWDISKLKTVPSDIQHLEKLQVLEFSNCIEPDEVAKNPIIQHVPLVEISIYRDKDERYETRVIHHSRH